MSRKEQALLSGTVIEKRSLIRSRQLWRAWSRDSFRIPYKISLDNINDLLIAVEKFNDEPNGGCSLPKEKEKENELAPGTTNVLDGEQVRWHGPWARDQ